MRREVSTPRVPNFVKVTTAGKEEMYPLTSFDDTELEQMSKEWRLALFANRDRQKLSSGPIPLAPFPTHL